VILHPNGASQITPKASAMLETGFQTPEQNKK